MFGKPGTVEEGFLDAISAHPAFRYIATLQEGVSVGAAYRVKKSTEMLRRKSHKCRLKRCPGHVPERRSNEADDVRCVRGSYAS
jgi:hypothetical protein